MFRNSLRRPGLVGFAFAMTTVLGLSFSVVPPSTARAEEAKPAKKDSSVRLRPKGVTLTPSVKPAEAKAGETVTYQVTVKLNPGSHIYKFSTELYDKDQGPRNTTFDFFDPAGLTFVGDWKPSRPPTRKPEPAFENKVLEFYEDDVTWSRTLRIPPGTEPGKKTLRAQAGYMICNDKNCSIPGQWTLPDVVLTVLPGGESASATKDPAASPAASVPAAPKTPEASKPAPSEPAAAPTAVASSSTAEKSRATTAPASASASTAAPIGEVAQQAQKGLLSFLLFSAGGGLLALVMPCVWPMVPITVNFFVKQGHHNKGKTTGLAIAYCLAIIGVFTSFGVLVSFFFSAAALQNLANNAWLNAVVALLFLAFGLSLLGVFEISLPSFLLNASARGESRGGMIGVMFMALTLTITSFTCTFPVVGGLIVMAAGGKFFYPIIGLATFSAVLAFPFFLLALAPGLLAKMPKSGDWMNAVKVVGGLTEIGAALKFVNTAEISFGTLAADAWFDAQAVLSVWVVLAAVCGLYLLGLFRTDHDHDDARIGPGRLLSGSLFLALALFLSPALFGRPPQSRLWYLIVGIFPADVGELNAPAAGGTSTAEVEQKARSTDPDQAEREQTSVHGVVWGWSYKAASERAKAEGKPILIDFTGVNCANCRTMEQAVMPRPEVVKLLKEFVTVQLYTDFVQIGSLARSQWLALAEKNQDLLLSLAQEASNPTYVALDADGHVLKIQNQASSAPVFAKFLQDALEKYAMAKPQEKAKLARAETAR